MRPQYLAAAAMTGAAALAIAGFTALGSIFEYPQILQESTGHILESYRAHQGAVMAWFGVLAVGAALLFPMAVGLSRMTAHRVSRRAIVTVGAAAAAVQAVGLSRWFLLVPGISRDATDPTRQAAAHRRFETLHLWLGTILGETVGYALTATLTVLAVRAVTRHVSPRWTSWLGYASAALVATGVLVPLGVHAATLTNFAGYVAWSLWLLATAAVLLRRPTVASVPAPEPSLRESSLTSG